MTKLILNPLKGLQILNGENLDFRISKIELFEKIGKPSNINKNQLFYDDFEFRIDLDKEEKVEFIECIYGPFPEKTEIEIYGINPFKTNSSELIKLLSEQNDGEIDESQEPYCYAFIKSSVGIFRDSCENDIEEMILEMKSTGEYEGNKDWISEDIEKSKYFWTIGIGQKKYYE